MSEGKVDKSKWYYKLHQLQKRLTRSELNEGHSENKQDKRRGQLKRLMDRVRGKNYYKNNE